MFCLQRPVAGKPAFTGPKKTRLSSVDIIVGVKNTLDDVYADVNILKRNTDKRTVPAANER